MNGVISAPEPEAVEAGAEALRRGGNAVDAAVTCAFVQGVVDPPMCGIAGWGSLHVMMPKRNIHETVDFYATAPAAARPDMWADKLVGETRDGWGFLVEGHENELGYRAIAVPGSLKGYHEAHVRFGKLPWAKIVQPAIDLAEGGFALRPHFYRFLIAGSAMGRAAPRDKMRFSVCARRLFYDGAGDAWPPGTILRNPDLAGTLRRIARDGSDVFYRGEIAERMAADIQAHGGLVTLDDFRSYATRWRKPLLATYRGHAVATNTPPGGGAVLIEMLQILDHFNLRALGHNSPDYVRTVAEAMKCATADKDRYLGDPDFVDVPLAHLLDRERTGRIAQRIRDGEVFGVPRLQAAPDKHTTHVSVLDEEGNAVGITHSLGMVSGVMTEGLGFFYNGSMGVFDPRPGRAGSIAPGKRRYTSACPTIVMRDGEPALVIGAPGGAHIANGVLQGIVNTIDFGMSLPEACAAPRFSATSDVIDVTSRIPRSVTAVLEARGYRVMRSVKSYDFAEVHAVGRFGGEFTGGADPSADGMALAVDGSSLWKSAARSW